MSHKLNFRFKPGYLYVKATGDRSIDTLVSLAGDYIKVCEQKGYKKILVDVRCMTGKLSTIDAYYLGREARKRLGVVHPGLKSAVVDLEENQERLHFLENVLVNSGFNIRFFSNVADAERWFNGPEDTSN